MIGPTTRSAAEWIGTLRCARPDGWKRKNRKEQELSNLRGVDPHNKGNRGSRESRDLRNEEARFKTL